MSTQEPETTVPVNPFTRFRDIIPGERLASLSFTIVGAGGLGAPCALALAKMGVKQMDIWDPDVINEENMGPQMYGRRQLGQFKVDALKNFLRGQAEWCKVTVHKDLYTEESSNTSDVVIVALDSLRARKGVWSTIDPDVCQLYIDPRMGAEVLNVISVVPKEDSDWYPETLEGDPVVAKCTEKSTFHCGLIGGAMAAREVKAWLVGERTLVDYSVCLRLLSILGDDQTTRKKRYAAGLAEAAE